MAERRVTVALFQNTPLVSTGAAARIQSSFVNLTADVVSVLGILYNVSSIVSTADLGFFYANSPDGIRVGSYADNAAIQASTFSTANSTGWFMASAPAINAPYIQVTASGTGSNPTDTRVNAFLVLRMS